MYRRGKLNTIFEDNIVFRELNPINKALPQFEEIKQVLHLDTLPRKKDILYAKVLSYIFKSMRDFKKILYIGDTLMSDGSVIRNLAQNREFQVAGIITREGEKEKLESDGEILLNTRWQKLPDAVKILENSGFSIDKKTVLVIDIDKTAIGARGRNDGAIDRARMDAIFQIASDIFGSIDRKNFFGIYSRVNRKDLFHITADNQDIVSIVSILVYGGAINFSQLEELHNGEEVLRKCIKNTGGRLKDVTLSVYKNIKNGNPTPFPMFRKAEFEKTIKRMDFLSDDVSVSDLLTKEITTTEEVFDCATRAKDRGGLVFGVSDKPALSTIPCPDTDLPPIYEKEMKIFGEH
jgi:hypothetical protein